MFISVIILGACIACQVNTRQAAVTSTSYIDLSTNNRHSSRNNHASSHIQSEQIAGIEYEYEDDNQTNGHVNGQKGTSSEHNTNSIPSLTSQHSTTESSDNIEPLIGGKPLERVETFISDPNKPQALTAREMVYHVGIYSRLYAPYMQICGGTLVTLKAVISAAHCFWDDKDGAIAPPLFAVGAGKRYRPWNEPHDDHSQKSDVAEIHIPVRYRGSSASYQEDIAVVVLVDEFKVNIAVRPACVSFDEDMDNKQLEKGSMGMILGWGLTQEDGNPSQVLNYLELPAVTIEECINNADASFRRYITSDKICAGVTTGKAVCRGDSGGGLVFAESARADEPRVPYLRAVASTAPRSEHKCNAYALAAFSHLRAHREFVRRHIPGVEEECEKHYPGTGITYEEEKEKEPENVKSTRPVQFVCNCYCNNTQPIPEIKTIHD